MKRHHIELIVLLVIVPMLLGFVFARVDACGWRGLFVECRIIVNAKDC